MSRQGLYQLIPQCSGSLSVSLILRKGATARHRGAAVICKPICSFYFPWPYTQNHRTFTRHKYCNTHSHTYQAKNHSEASPTGQSVLNHITAISHSGGGERAPTEIKYLSCCINPHCCPVHTHTHTDPYTAYTPGIHYLIRPEFRHWGVCVREFVCARVCERASDTLQC